MGAERKLLEKIKKGDDDGDFFLSSGIYNEIRTLLAQSEQEPDTWKDRTYDNLHLISPQIRNPLSNGEIYDGWKPRYTHSLRSFEEGVKFAEKAHGITIKKVKI